MFPSTTSPMVWKWKTTLSSTFCALVPMHRLEILLQSVLTMLNKQLWITCFLSGILCHKGNLRLAAILSTYMTKPKAHSLEGWLAPGSDMSWPALTLPPGLLCCHCRFLSHKNLCSACSCGFPTKTEMHHICECPDAVCTHPPKHKMCLAWFIKFLNTNTGIFAFDIP
jgi:hypothetical protein